MTLSPTLSRRRFRLGDAMAIVAAMGVGCGAAIGIDRATDDFMDWSSLKEMFTSYFTQSPSTVDNRVFSRSDLVAGIGVTLMGLSLPFTAVLTVTIVPLRFLSPRPRFSRLVRQPGTMAAIAASLGIAIAAAQVACTLFCSVFGGAATDMLFVLALLGGVASREGRSAASRRRGKGGSGGDDGGEEGPAQVEVHRGPKTVRSGEPYLANALGQVPAGI
jgi:hypothetical protein